MELIDTHCHLDVPEFDPDREAVLRRAQAAGVTTIVNPGIHADEWPRLIELAQSSPGVHYGLGLHPVYLERHSDADLERLEQLLAETRPVAVGEIGLDFYLRDLDRERQQRLFEAQLVIARDADLPVILHVRKAHDQVLQALKRIRVRGGIAHAFNGSLQQAQQYLDLGFRFGFGGMLTFERSRKLRELAAALPLESLVLETDAPDLTVAAHQGERNSPEYLPDCLAALAGVRGIAPEEAARATSANARAALGLVEL
ncbi:TatD family hydrolase [Thiohalobacter thiocyanaticus]|uniref:TatD family deoxyribonuclease n=1 Tax=Thiohalobacter thiocyanaticus TaxID=585455 RepID=A0A426QMD4_9GAMM|nr:TatD family hydrolase [Thiohalobacter thiocyanaticus]RRQ22920.1 TatD family deoxyribonuclease [Thiohalobacter thiocyanaticus]